MDEQEQQVSQQLAMSSPSQAALSSPLDSSTQLVNDAVRSLHLPIPPRITHVEGPVLQLQPVQGDKYACDIRVLTSFRAHFDPASGQHFHPPPPGPQQHLYPQAWEDQLQLQELTANHQAPQNGPPLSRSRSAPTHLHHQQQQLHDQRPILQLPFLPVHHLPHLQAQTPQQPQQQPVFVNLQQQQQQQRPVLVWQAVQPGTGTRPAHVVIESESSGGRSGSYHYSSQPDGGLRRTTISQLQGSHQSHQGLHYSSQPHDLPHPAVLQQQGSQLPQQQPLSKLSTHGAHMSTQAAVQLPPQMVLRPASSQAGLWGMRSVPHPSRGALSESGAAQSVAVSGAQGGGMQGEVVASRGGMQVTQPPLVVHSPFAAAAYIEPPPPSLETSRLFPSEAQQQQQPPSQHSSPQQGAILHQASPFAGAGFQIPWSLPSLPHGVVQTTAAAAAVAVAAAAQGTETKRAADSGEAGSAGEHKQGCVGPGLEPNIAAEGHQQGVHFREEPVLCQQQQHGHPQQQQQHYPHTNSSSMRSGGGSVHSDSGKVTSYKEGAGPELVSQAQVGGAEGSALPDGGSRGSEKYGSAGSRGSASPCKPDGLVGSRQGREDDSLTQEQRAQGMNGGRRESKECRSAQSEGQGGQGGGQHGARECWSGHSGRCSGSSQGEGGMVLACGERQQELMRKGMSASSPVHVVPLRLHYCEQLAAAADAARLGHIEAAVREVERTQQALDEAARVPFSAIAQAWPHQQNPPQHHLDQLQHPGQVQLLPAHFKHKQQEQQPVAGTSQLPGAAIQALARTGSRAGTGMEVGHCSVPSSEWELNGQHVQYGKRIAVGGFAEVFAGRYLGTLVAIKKLLATDADAVRHFAHEVRVLARLRHPNLILFIGYCLHPEPAILYEFMPRGSLFNIMRQHKGPLELRLQRAVAGCVARGMAYLHSRNPPILHLDLKSPNILVDAQWRIKVCDFGLSAVRRQAFLSSACAGGTPEWMAPEMLRCEDYDEKADIWSFGVVLWELLTGEVPFVDLSPMQVVGMVGFKRQSLEPPGQGDSTLQQLCVSCMTQNPLERPSFTSILEIMDQAYHHNGSGGMSGFGVYNPEVTLQQQQRRQQQGGQQLLIEAARGSVPERQTDQTPLQQTTTPLVSSQHTGKGPLETDQFNQPPTKRQRPV